MAPTAVNKVAMAWIDVLKTVATSTSPSTVTI
jgi:hypothetical protein